MTLNKLRKAVSSVLSAWTNWSVYDITFIDELECKFEGRELTVTGKINLDQDVQEEDEKDEAGGIRSDTAQKEALASGDKDLAAVSTTPRGTWTSATDDNDTEVANDDVDGKVIDKDMYGEGDIDGEDLDGEDLDGEELDDTRDREDDIDGEALDG